MRGAGHAWRRACAGHGGGGGPGIGVAAFAYGGFALPGGPVSAPRPAGRPVVWLRVRRGWSRSSPRP
ncbi:hypothetical protein C6Y14_21815 [Streptomyces dioscori]|uniref:Uncharacterized protein n=1 Tax=Streptomyces dioscori TaxID=2109333 RepID=A0A2P8Q575_9ACTN|nr:hypothetical protein C6Y14_21815 [Streptomyces dioscori]